MIKGFKQEKFIYLLNYCRIMSMNKSLVYIFLFALGIFLLGSGITGFASLNNEFEYCVDDTNCYGGAVCCEFYGFEEGLCDSNENCDEVYEISKVEVQEKGFLSPLDMDQIAAKVRATEVVNANSVFVLIGTLMLFAGFGLFKKLER